MAMAGQALVATTTSFAQLASARNGMGGSTSLQFAPSRVVSVRGPRIVKITAQAASGVVKDVPDMGKRNLMNLLLLGAISLPSLGLIGPYLYFLVPPGSGGGGAGVTAKDAFGNDVTRGSWLKTHFVGDRTLAQGLKGDPTYLVVEGDGNLATFGVNAVCTHLGCVVPYNQAEKKFICPCHGSQYDGQGKVVRGPAPLSLQLAHVAVDENDKVVLTPWPETDFRTGENPWWS